MFARAWGARLSLYYAKTLDKLADYLRYRVEGVEIQSMVDTEHCQIELWQSVLV